MKFAATFFTAAFAVGSTVASSENNKHTSVPKPIVDPSKGFPFERLNKNDSMLVILDLQEGLYNLARDWGTQDIPTSRPSSHH
jgi:hypothetical protein